MILFFTNIRYTWHSNIFFLCFIQLWDYKYSHCIGMYKGHQASISSLKYSPDGLWIASGDNNGKVVVCNICLVHALMKPLIFCYYVFNRYGT